MDLDRCIKLLKNSKTDNEMMAALMLVAKLLNSSDIGADGRKKVFDAVGFSFINRLLATGKLPEGCTENPYHRIAVTILACFCTDQDLALHPQITSKIPTFNDFLLEPRSSGAGVEEDQSSTLASESLQCLQALSSSDVGVLHLLRNKTPESLARVLVMQSPAVEFDAARNLLLCIIGHEKALSAGSYHTTASNVLTLLAKEFNARQDELKFLLCDVLYSVLSLAGESLVHSMESVSSDSVVWLGETAAGLTDILTSRIDPTRKNKALQLAAILTHLLGVDWAVQTNVKFFMILVNLVSVELRMAIEGQELSSVIENSSLLCSYFVILEHSVVFISQQSDLSEAGSGCLLTQGNLAQLHTTLTEAFIFVIHILNTIREFSSEAGSTEKLESLTTAAVRVLGAWLAEETLALSSDVYRLLPFLVELCQRRLKKGEVHDLLKFLLPGFSHLSAEDKPRKILLKANLHNLLLTYMQHLLPQHLSLSELSGRLALCCEVMMNVCITESEMVKNDETFTSIAFHSLQIVNANDKCSRLNISAALLSLLIIRRQGFERISTQMNSSEQSSAWSRVLLLLLHTVKLCPQVSTLRQPMESQSADQISACSWSDVSELWFLAMQELTALATHSQEFGLSLLQGVSQSSATSQCSVVQEFTGVLRAFVQLQKDDEESQSISASITSLLPSLTTSTHAQSS